MSEVYISTDVEADGPIPGPHSMLSFASCVVDPRKSEITDMFTRNLVTLPGATMHPKTEEFWNKNPEAYAKTRKNLSDPADAMRAYINWLKRYDSVVFLAYPVGFDFTFIYWYLTKFCDDSPFRHSALDIRSYAAGMLKRDYRASTKKTFPRNWFNPNIKHSHVALDDALEQGYLFLNMLKSNK